MAALIYGLVTGILFGFFLQKARVIRYDKQLGALRLIDMTIVKFMVSSILVGMVGVYLLLDLGWVKLSLKSTNLGGNIIGGLIFGLGWGLLGYCPGTSAGALGEGRWDALWGILGMIAGAAIAHNFGLASTPEGLGPHGAAAVVLGMAVCLVIGFTMRDTGEAT